MSKSLRDDLARILTEASATGGVIHENSTLVDDALQAFSKRVPEKQEKGTTFNMNLEEVCRYDGSVEGYNQAIDVIEGELGG